MQIKTKIVSCHTADSKPVKQEVNSTVILPPLVFPGLTNIDESSRGSSTKLLALEAEGDLDDPGDVPRRCLNPDGV